MQPLQTTNERLARQRPGRFGENHLQSKNYARNPITLLPMGKDLLHKTRIALFVDSTIKSSYNSSNTLMDVRLMNMPCTTLNEMAEVTDKIFTPAGTKTIPLPPILVYSNVIDHLALRGSLRHFDTQSNRFTSRHRRSHGLHRNNVLHCYYNEEQKTEHRNSLRLTPWVHSSPKSTATILIFSA